MKPSSKASLASLAALAALLLAGCGPVSNGGQTSPDDVDIVADTGDAGRTDEDGGQRTDAASEPDAGSPGEDGGAAAGLPIEAADETWTWVDFPNSACGNGEPTGIAVNLTDRSDDVFVFFQGGGACWDVNSCFILKSAVNIETGYTAGRFGNDAIQNAAGFSRDTADNPLKDMSFVYVPYCTGDLHAGDSVKTYMAAGQTRDVHYRGAHNVDEFLDRLIPTFPDASRVFVSGSSAGGYGAQFNMHRFVEAFGDSEVHVLSDSGPLLQPYGDRFGLMKTAWDIQVPEGCPDCDESMPKYLDYLVGDYPNSRFGLLAYDADQTIHAYFNYPFGTSFQMAMTAFARDHYQADNTRVYLLPGTQHVMLGALMTLAPSNRPTLRDWTQAWIDGSADWVNVGVE